MKCFNSKIKNFLKNFLKKPIDCTIVFIYLSIKKKKNHNLYVKIDSMLFSMNHDILFEMK